MLFAGSLGLFLFGGVKFMYSKMMGDSKILESHQQHMLWGIVGMFIMASAFGILAFISNSIRAVGGVVGV